MKTKSGRIDDSAELIDYLSHKYLYEIMELVYQNREERGLIMIRLPELSIDFVGRADLISIAASTGNTSTLRSVLKLTSEYNHHSEVLLTVVDDETKKLLAFATLEIKWETINLKEDN